MRNVGEIVEISHGGGGKRMDALIEFLLDKMGNVAAENVVLDSRSGDDGAYIQLSDPWEKFVISTDSHTVDPVFFKGGNIGDLSIIGTVNDVVVMGAEPQFLSLGVIIEEGFLVEDLGKIFETIGSRVKETGISIVTGDTKVMPKGMLEGLVTNTTGFGKLIRDKPLSVAEAKPGDKVIVSGPVGDHGASLMAHRKGIDLDTELNSDVAPFWPYWKEIVKHPGLHVMKDCTRGGIASALNDIARGSKVLLEITEEEIPIREETQAICDILGLEVLEVSSEGTGIMTVEEEFADEVLAMLREQPISSNAKIIGTVKPKPQGRVHVITEIGGTRLLDKPYGEPIPRVC